MKTHKKPPIRNNATVIPVKVSDFQKAAEDAVERAIWLMEEALKEEFKFGKARIERLRAKVEELARHKNFETYVDYTIKGKLPP
ncbi:hypothetical protein POF51_22225 [Brevibacillus sp. AG]|uniref:hypothetical protein n=1 Tax=Brevibacillus sp. AG TaxID=3020891 RepID=UPI00232BB513|nr:hypothetical protein [Brevibacillus sp. AG]MDC0763445.1 hypothetical protein [Brevibacillus sp. AG]